MMSPLQMFLPASEPARSEALAALQKNRHLPRHLVRGIARGASGKRAMAEASAQMEQQLPPSHEARDAFRQFG
jgi:hypothetical protein